MKIFARDLIYFLIIQACLFAGIVLLYMQYRAERPQGVGEGYFSASIDKHELLMRQPSPRIVFVGGSNLALGLDSPKIEQYLGYHPINMGLNMALGLDFML